MISNNHVYIKMHFYCIFCDIEVKTDLRKHRECSRLVKTHTINFPKISDIDRNFNGYVFNHNRKFELYTLEVIFKIEYKIKDFHLVNDGFFSLDFYSKQLNFSHNSDMIIKPISDIRYMTNQHYINNPMQMVERRLNLIIAKNPHLIYSLSRKLCHPPIRKKSDVPFNNY